MSATSRELQIAQVREWMVAANGRTYKKRDKRLFVRLEYDNQSVTMHPSEALDWLSDSEDATYHMMDVWMTQAQFEKLPEFEGF